MAIDKLQRSRMSRRRAVQSGTAALALGGLALAGCGSNSKNNKNGNAGSSAAGAAATGAAGAPSSAGATPAPKRGGTVVIGELADIVPATLPYQMSPANYFVLFNVFDVLAKASTTSSDLEPRLAQSWQLAADGLSLTIKLRPGITFHDGKPITADIVQQNIEAVGKPENKSQAAGLVKQVKSMQAQGTDTLVVTFTAPTTYFTDLFITLPIADPTNFDNITKAQNINGSGPFKFVSWTPNQSVQVQRWEGHWDAARTYLDGMTKQVFPNPQSATAALQTNQLQMASGLNYSDLSKFQSGNSIVVLGDPGDNNDHYMGVVADFGPFKDKRVRQALAYCVDRARISKEIYLGIETTRNFLWPDTSPAYDPQYANVYEFNLDKAKQLLSDAGMPNGYNGTIPVEVTTAAPTDAAVAQIIQSDAKQVGLNFEIQQLQYADFLNQLATASFNGTWIAQLGYVGFHPGAAYIEGFPIRLHSPSHLDKLPEGQQYGDLITKVAGLKPNDPTEKQTYKDLDAFLVDQSFLIPFAKYRSLYAASKRVQGFEAGTSSLPYFGHISLA